MWNKKDRGGFKPLWVKCGCGKWNGVQVGVVLKYLEKTLSKPLEGADQPPVEKTEKANA